ncbi:MAG: SARP family transcriptional regulator, partial [Chloroflexales bacterium]|nr:SARP family transcriptional regulator [Chloroflexales bacterium]
MALSLSLLGPFQISAEGLAVSFPLATARALLAYLAIEADRAHSRELLAALLWPDQPQNAAYANLRQTLARARKALGPHADIAALLTITPQTLQWAGAGATVDTVRFERLLAECAAHPHPDLVGCAACAERLGQATELYRGELLHGLFLDKSQPFEEWLLVKREHTHRQAIEALHALTLHHEANAEYEQMRQCAARQLALEPWREEAHQQLMRALALSGERGAA